MSDQYPAAVILTIRDGQVTIGGEIRVPVAAGFLA